MTFSHDEGGDKFSTWQTSLEKMDQTVLASSPNTGRKKWIFTMGKSIGVAIHIGVIYSIEPTMNLGPITGCSTGGCHLICGY